MSEGPARQQDNTWTTGSRSRLDASFVVVLWLESGRAGHDAEWRWRVRCVQSGAEKCFRRVGDVLTFVAAEAAAPPPR